MSGLAMRQYRVVVSKDPGTGSVVADVPALRIADYGVDVPEALANIKAMAAFHLECLQEEGKPVPPSEDGEEGFYVHVKLPAHHDVHAFDHFELVPVAREGGHVVSEGGGREATAGRPVCVPVARPLLRLIAAPTPPQKSRPGAGSNGGPAAAHLLDGWAP